MSTSPNKIHSASRYRLQNRLGKLLVHGILILIGLTCLIPMVLVISISLSDELEIARNGYSFLPVGFTTSAYEYILQQPAQIIRAYGTTIAVTLLGTAGGLLISSLLGYALSRKDYKLRGYLSFFVFFTLLFNGGKEARFEVFRENCVFLENAFHCGGVGSCADERESGEIRILHKKTSCGCRRFTRKKQNEK